MLAARAAAWGPLLPRPSGALDRDPIALALAALAAGFAILYLVAALAGARPRARMALLAVAAVLLVALPTAAFVAMGVVTGRPYGQDGGVVQLPLAIDRILSGQSPYGADYSDSMLGRQARVSDFWTEHGGNPILHHAEPQRKDPERRAQPGGEQPPEAPLALNHRRAKRHGSEPG